MKTTCTPKMSWTTNTSPRLLVASCSCGWGPVEMRGDNVARLKKHAREVHLRYCDFVAKHGRKLANACGAHVL